MPAPTSWKMVEVVQQTRFGFTKDIIANVLKDWSSVKDYAYILHDKDNDENLHCHLALRFNGAVPTTAIINKLRKAGVELDETRLEKVKGKWASIVSYLTHRNAPEKHQYDYSEVVANFDVESMTEQYMEQKRTKDEKEERKNEIITLIASGVIREYNLDEYISPTEYNDFKRAIDNAFRYRKLKRTTEIGKEDRGMEVIFITGASGVGKDEFAKDYAIQNGYSLYRCSNSEKPFDDYKGQDVVVWSDARDNERKPTEILRLLDNHQNTLEHARYSNIVLECKTFIITSIKPLSEWYAEAYKDRKEDRAQLYRRVKTVVMMTRQNVRFAMWDDSQQKHVIVNPENPIPNKWFARYEQMFLDTPEKRVKALQSTLGALVDTSQFLKDYVDTHQTELEDFIKAKDEKEIPFTE